MRCIVEHAQAADTAAICEILDEAARWQRARGMPQWTPGSFSDEISMTLADGHLYVARASNAVVGCFMLDVEPPRWIARWLADHDLPVEGAHLSRLAVAAPLRGNGVGARLIAGALEIAARNRLARVRLDHPAENAGLRRFYLGRGFTAVGDIALSGPRGERWTSSLYERDIASR
jgi:ribosomal protein S18 acetylase RimI-like enzyme